MATITLTLISNSDWSWRSDSLGIRRHRDEPKCHTYSLFPKHFKQRSSKRPDSRAYYDVFNVYTFQGCERRAIFYIVCDELEAEI